MLAIEHQASCPPALLGDWLAEGGVRLRVCRPWAGDALPGGPDGGPDGGGYAGLLVLGGSMGAMDDDTVPWLAPLKELLRATVAADVPLLGVCLGHQLLAVALGGEVVVNPRGQQAGLLPVGWLPEAAHDPLLGPLVAGAERGLQWNHDLVAALPPGATALARTPEGDLQAARFAPRAWGVQTHPEADRAVVAPWAARDREEHRARGIDQAALLAELEAARPELVAAWSPLGAGFAREVRRGRLGTAGRGPR